MKPLLFIFFVLCGVYLGFALTAAVAPFTERLEVAISRPWFPREATTPAAERELAALVAHCGTTWDGFACVAHEPCRLDCRDVRRALLWSKPLSESVCARLR